jgi:hypothetical protein
VSDDRFSAITLIKAATASNPHVVNEHTASQSTDAAAEADGSSLPDESAGRENGGDFNDIAGGDRKNVRVLEGKDLGLLNVAKDDENTLARVKAQAMSRKMSEDSYWYGMDHQAARDPQRNAYLGSPTHLAWAQAASLRTGGRLDAQWLRAFDPFGGIHDRRSAVSGIDSPPLSETELLHSIDWSLGRYFNAGPLEALYDAKLAHPDLGGNDLRGSDDRDAFID